MARIATVKAGDLQLGDEVLVGQGKYIVKGVSFVHVTNDAGQPVKGQGVVAGLQTFGGSQAYPTYFGAGEDIKVVLS